MSINPDRIPLLKAQLIANKLRSLWQLGDQCLVVGSVRRLENMVGDLEYTAPLPIAGQEDDLFDVMQSTISQQGSLFGDGEEKKRSISGRAVAGFSRNFKFCNLLIEIPEELVGGKGPALFPIKVQIHRYTPSCRIQGVQQISNRGWIELMRTGPREFGQQFLLKWRAWHRIPDAIPASKEGFLCDREGKPVDTPTEQSCFSQVNNWRFIPPEEREHLADAMRSKRAS